MNDDLCDKRTGIVPKTRNDNSILEQSEEVKKKKKNDYYALKFTKSDKTRFLKLRRFKVSIFQIQQ